MPQLNPNVLNCLVEDFRALRAARDSDPGFIMMAIADPYRPPAPHIIEAYHQGVDTHQRYSPISGQPDLRVAIARKMKEQNGVDVDPDAEILVTHGAGNGFLVALMTFLQPGDEVLTAEPSFPLNWGSVQLLGCKPVGCRIDGPDGVAGLPKAMAAAITPRTRAIILHNPNNPTGDVMSREVLAEIAQLAIKHDLAVVSDEVYEQFVYDGPRPPSIAGLPGMKDRTVTLCGFSKEHSISGARVGYLTSSPRIVAAISRILQNNGVGANSAGQRAALAALTGPQDALNAMRAEFGATRRDVVRRINAMPGLKCALPPGGCFVFVDARAYGDSLALCSRFIKEARIGVSPGDWNGPAGAGHFRIVYGGQKPEIVREALDRLDAFFRREAASPQKAKTESFFIR